MTDFCSNKLALQENGFSIVEGVFKQDEINEITNFIEQNKFEFTERRLLNRFPELQEVIFQSKRFRELYNTICDKNRFQSYR